MDKFCIGCRLDKDLNDFACNKAKIDGKQIYCRSCKKEMDAKYYSHHKESFKARCTRHSKKKQIWFKQLKERLGGCPCGEREPCCLDFHHEHDKIERVSQMLSNCGRKKILEEIAKCVLVCSNCHRKIHNGLKPNWMK